MRFFSHLYQRVLDWARHRHAPWYLAGLSVAESSFFPIPPDVMLVPMALANPRRSFLYAAIATTASVLGGALGYMIGALAFDLITPWLHELDYWSTYLHAREWFEMWGLWIVLLAGFSPIPYKIFTITAGVMSMAFLPFLLVSFLGRGGRFFLVALIMRIGGERLEPVIRRHIDTLGWVFAIILGILFLVMNI
ncbi:MAG: DedA family protein [Gammaproteobacteria bacterium]|nr:MAG: DedA family protein [Gammaproteobacteria bacterium]